MDQKPSIGRIVHFRAAAGEQARPAIITQVFSDICVNLEVFGVETNRLQTSVLIESSAGGAMHWFWPPRV